MCGGLAWLACSMAQPRPRALFHASAGQTSLLACSHHAQGSAASTHALQPPYSPLSGMLTNTNVCCSAAALSSAWVFSMEGSATASIGADAAAALAATLAAASSVAAGAGVGAGFGAGAGAGAGAGCGLGAGAAAGAGAGFGLG